jgi:hypothetical protein
MSWPLLLAACLLPPQPDPAPPLARLGAGTAEELPVPKLYLPPPPETPPDTPQPEAAPPAPPSPPAAKAPPPAPPPAPPAAPDRWFLMRQLQGTWMGSVLDDNRTSVSGWFQASFTASTDAITNQPMTWNDRANEFLLQQAWVKVARRIVTTGTTEPTFGFEIDILSGSDYRFTLPRGLFNSQLVNSTGANNLYGVDPIQHYVSVNVPTLFQGVEFRLGRVYTPICPMESLEGVTNPVLSRSYMFNFDPFTHCGLAAYVTFNPAWSAILMLTNGNDIYFGQPGEELRFMGSLKWTQPGGGRNVLEFDTSVGRGKFVTAFPFAPATVGALASEPLGQNNLNVFDGAWTHVFSSVLTYNLCALFGYQTNAVGIARPNGYGTATWMSVLQYLTYTLSPQWSAVLRTEAFDDFQGQRTGFTGVYLAATAALVFKPRKDVQIRQELRYDYNPESAPFEGKHQLFTAGTDVIFRW